jgi:hypothetical protein
MSASTKCFEAVVAEAARAWTWTWALGAGIGVGEAEAETKAEEDAEACCRRDSAEGTRRVMFATRMRKRVEDEMRFK